MVLASNASDKMWMPIVKVIKCEYVHYIVADLNFS